LLTTASHQGAEYRCDSSSERSSYSFFLAKMTPMTSNRHQHYTISVLVIWSTRIFWMRDGSTCIFWTTTFIFWTADVTGSVKAVLRSGLNEYTAFCNGAGDVKSPRVIVTPPSSRFCPWSAPRPPHYAVRRNGEPILSYLATRGSSEDGHWPCNGFTNSTVLATGLRAVGPLFGPLASRIPP
jgi:hypothetical protein